MKRWRVFKKYIALLGFGLVLLVFYTSQWCNKSANFTHSQSRGFQAEDKMFERKSPEYYHTTSKENTKNYISITIIKQFQKQIANHIKQEKVLRKQLELFKEHNRKLRNKVKEKKYEGVALPTIFLVTPTFKRFVQKAELTRVWQAVKTVRNIHWIVVEDSVKKTELVKRLLNSTGLSYTHLNIRTPEELRRRKGDRRRMKPRGVEQRNLALQWIRENVDPDQTKGVVYFADDDNTYDSRLFEEMRFIKGVGVWPVAFTGAARWAGPICTGGHVTGFHINWGEWRPFPLDMAGFAINIHKIIREYPEAIFRDLKKPGMLESSLLQEITSVDDLEPMASNCTKVYVWHTRSEVPLDSIRGERKLIANGRASNSRVET